MKNILRDPPNRRKKPILGVIIAHQILQNPLEKYVFLLCGLTWVRISYAISSFMSGPITQHTLFYQNFCIFSEKCSPPSVGSIIFDLEPQRFALKCSCLGPPSRVETHVLVTVFARFVPFLVRLVLYALQSPIKSLLAARELCVFSLCSPIRCIQQATDALKRQ